MPWIGCPLIPHGQPSTCSSPPFPQPHPTPQANKSRDSGCIHWASWGHWGSGCYVTLREWFTDFTFLRLKPMYIHYVKPFSSTKGANRRRLVCLPQVWLLSLKCLPVFRLRQYFWFGPCGPSRMFVKFWVGFHREVTLALANVKASPQSPSGASLSLCIWALCFIYCFRIYWVGM